MGAADGNVELTTCTDRWKVAVADILKWMGRYTEVRDIPSSLLPWSYLDIL